MTSLCSFTFRQTSTSSPVLYNLQLFFSIFQQGGIRCTVVTPWTTSQQVYPSPGAWFITQFSLTIQNHGVTTIHFHLSAERLSNFKVGLTNISPQQQAPTVGNYEECATVNELLGAGQKKLVACSGKGRYLVIQLIPKNYLTLCEVEVFGGMWHFAVVDLVMTLNKLLNL